MNLLSEHNRILSVGNGGYSAGGDMWTSGLEYSGDKITGYSGSAFGCPCDSAAIIDSAYDKTTAWVDEQGYLTAHQDVSNLPYVQNSALGYNDSLISGISGSGFFAESANFINSGWEHDSDGYITAYNNSAFAGGRYEGINPIVVNNEFMRISAKSALLGVQDPLYFVEDSETATVIGIQDSYIPYTEITTGDSGTTCYNVASAIRVTATSGWVEMTNQNTENEAEAHLQVGQNYSGGNSFWSEIDGAGTGIIQMNWNSAHIGPNTNADYFDTTTAHLVLWNGGISYHSANHNLTVTGEGGDVDNKIWQLDIGGLRYWDSAGNNAAVFGPNEYSAWNTVSYIVGIKSGYDHYSQYSNPGWWSASANNPLHIVIETANWSSGGTVSDAQLFLTQKTSQESAFRISLKIQSYWKMKDSYTECTFATLGGSNYFCDNGNQMQYMMYDSSPVMQVWDGGWNTAATAYLFAPRTADSQELLITWDGVVARPI